VNIKGWVCLISYFAISCWDVWLLRDKSQSALFLTSVVALVLISMVLGWMLIQAFNMTQRRRRRLAK